MLNDVFNGININYGDGQVYKQLLGFIVWTVLVFPSPISCRGHMKIKVIPVIRAIKKSHHNQVFKSIKKQSMKAQSIHVTNAIIKQDEMSSLQSIRKPT